MVAFRGVSFLVLRVVVSSPDAKRVVVRLKGSVLTELLILVLNEPPFVAINRIFRNLPYVVLLLHVCLKV